MSTTSQDQTRLQVDISVDVPVEHAFRVFTEHFDEIKPREHNLLSVPIERTVLEPRAGGTIYDVITWDISPRWQVEPDPGRASEVEVRFIAETPERTRVVLEHRHLDRHGEGWEGFTHLDTGDGWPLYLERYRAVAERLAAES